MENPQSGPVSKPAAGGGGLPPADSINAPYAPPVDPKSVKGYGENYKPKFL